MKLIPVLLIVLLAGCTYVPITGSGNTPDIVMVCHGGKEIEVPSSVAAEHRDHGDNYGRCR